MSNPASKSFRPAVVAALLAAPEGLRIADLGLPLGKKLDAVIETLLSHGTADIVGKFTGTSDDVVRLFA